MRSYSWLNTTNKIVQSYDGSMPLAAWLKQFFKADKKFGSKDRKQISHLCYCYYRTGNAFQNLDAEERILTATFLCSTERNKVLEELMPDWNEQVSLSLVEKIDLLSAQEAIKNIFPLNDELSNEIDVSAFGLSLLKQPDLFLRLRPGKKEKVLKQLQIASIDFDWCSDDCVRLPNQTKLDEIIKLDKDAVVQDCNSQRVLDVLKNSKLKTLNSKLSVWDCCAASGGKSILFYDRFPNSHLTVSDVRESILFNLRKRFNKAGITKYGHFVADLTLPNIPIDKNFDVVICDAPCSGSGTWARTPQQLAFFNKEKIDHYSNLQKNIVLNAGKAIKHGGYFLYITCSVFKKENEEVVDFIRENLPLTLVEKQYLKGYDKKADTLFVALFSQL
mgnify:CR=1 FL=1